MASHIPDGFVAVTPYLLIEDAKGFLEFAREALGATERFTTYDDGGRLVHGEIELEGCVIELGQPQADFTPTRTSLHVFVEDPDAAWARATKHGAVPLYEVQDHDYGERSGGVADRWGNQWYFSAVTDPEVRAGATSPA